MDEDDKEYLFRWGLPLSDLYAIAVKFFKEKEGNVIQFSYGEKLKLVAYTRQVTHGKYNEDVLSPLGVLDVIGRDRRIAWQSLGDMKPRDAMAAFVQLIDKSCLHFKTFVQAQKSEMDEQRKKVEEKAKVEIEMQQRSKIEKEEKLNGQDGKCGDEEIRRRHIQEALNAQTFHQFKSYAEQQYPGNPEEQAVLIRQLQDQHYHKYMLHLKQEQEKNKKNEDNINNNSLSQQRNGLRKSVKSEDCQQQDKIKNSSLVVNGGKHCHHCVVRQTEEKQMKHEKSSALYRKNSSAEVENIIDTRRQQNGEEFTSLQNYDQTIVSKENGTESNEMNLLINPDTISRVISDENSDSEDSEVGVVPISQSYMWTQKNIEEFKADIKEEGGETIIKVSHGEIVTIRVPTREDGNYLYWVFATDNYDIGFGVYFEWGKSSTNEVSIHISESEEDSDDLLEDEQDFSDVDAEHSQISTRSSSRNGTKPPTSVIVPIYRRDCHQEVYFGYHKYPADGVYLLKFDNSYSLWRSKTLYYRIYYTNYNS